MVNPTTVNILVPISVAIIGLLGIILASFITKHRTEKSFFKEMQVTYQGIIKDQDKTIINLRNERDIERQDVYKMKDHLQIVILEVEKLKKNHCSRKNCLNRLP